MKTTSLPASALITAAEMARSGHSKLFEGRLEASIAAIGLAEPLKVARVPSTDQFVIVDGMMRWKAIGRIRVREPRRFMKVPVYLVEYDQRFEIRFQTDIYQDLLPSQLARLVEHLHQTDGVTKTEIAQSIGVSPSTLRNYTGLWRLLQRGGLFAAVVGLMDMGVLPASNPYAWLRLNARGIRTALEQLSLDDLTAERWVEVQMAAARAGSPSRVAIQDVEHATGTLSDDCYRGDAVVRGMKKRLGLRRQVPNVAERRSRKAALARLDAVSQLTSSRLLRSAATSLQAYLT